MSYSSPSHLHFPRETKISHLQDIQSPVGVPQGYGMTADEYDEELRQAVREIQMERLFAKLGF